MRSTSLGSRWSRASDRTARTAMGFAFTRRSIRTCRRSRRRLWCGSSSRSKSIRVTSIRRLRNAKHCCRSGRKRTMRIMTRRCRGLNICKARSSRSTTSGDILALVGGRDFQHSQFNRATSAARPAGTAFMPLVYAAAFEKGIFSGTLFQDAVIDNRQVMIGGTTAFSANGARSAWTTNTRDRSRALRAREIEERRDRAARDAKAGLDRVLELSKQAGISSPLRKFPATYLGSSEVTLMDMTLAYDVSKWWHAAEQAGDHHADRGQKREGYFRRPRGTGTRDQERLRRSEIHSCLSQVLEWGSGDKAHGRMA